MRRAFALLVLLPLIGLAPAGRAENQAVLASPAAPAEAVKKAVLRCLAEMPEHQYFIGHKEFVGKVAAGDSMMIVDTRQPDDYARGHIRGAVNLPFGPVLAGALGQLPHSGPVFVYCYSGQSSAQTVMLLNMLGIPARSVTYGWGLGISKVDGVDAVISVEPSQLVPGQIPTTEPAALEASRAYFDQIAAGRGSRYAGNMVSEADAKALLDAKDGAVQFVSVQSSEEFARGHIEGAVNLPWGRGMDALLASLPKDKRLIVYCGSGQRSGQLVAALRLLGFDAVSLRNGLGTPGNYPAGWTAKGYSLVQ